MGRAEDDIYQVWVLGQNVRQRVEHVLDALARREQAEGQQHFFAFHPKFVLMEIGIDKRHVGNPMRDNVDLLRRDIVDLLQELAAMLRHHYKPGRERHQFLDDPAVLGSRLAEDRVQCRHHRHFQRPQQGQHMAARRPAKNAKLMLQGNRPDIGDIEKIRRPLIGREILLGDFEANAGRIIVSTLRIRYRDDKALRLRELGRKRFAQVRGERSDAAFPGQIITDKRELTYFRGCRHKYMRVLTRANIDLI